MLYLIASLLLLVSGCQKEKLTPAHLEGKWKWTCTVRSYSFEDTLLSFEETPTNLYFQTYGMSDESGKYSLDLFLDDQLIQHLIISDVELSSEKYWGNTWLSTIKTSDVHGYGYMEQAFQIDGFNYPSTPPYFMQVVDFPYPGWNRFMFQE